MGKLPENQRTVMILITLFLCLGSVVVCEVIDPLLTIEESLYISFADSFLQHTHLDEHDDDFVLSDGTAGSFIPVIIDQDRSSRVLGFSCPLIPLLPPPKAS